ncbi:hypothetical protein BT67DRAFT_384642 [Trichocladium antarcticum]|uniref:Xylanolytic transcriptional activator regulatory domain-containing protein n=1 Tax=Trichocladium antarcticum TaxID=1450529 RepID=A0AAN6UHB2_9PEZI|nr:hypothetical protein BT67DRAFT_384642 [Trichocladium antarcticum]
MSSSKPGTIPQVRFVGHDSSGLPVKRKQVHQACLPCRKRKKRCHHPADPGDEDVHARSGGDGCSLAHSPVSDRDASDAAAQLLRFFHHVSDRSSVSSNDDGQQQPRRHIGLAPPFLGDINPESILVEATMAPATRLKVATADEPMDGRMPGLLSPASPQQSDPSPGRDRELVIADSAREIEEVLGPFFSIPCNDGTRSTIQAHGIAQFAALAQTIVNRGLADKIMPSEAEWRAMRDLYLAKIHPIFPILERTTLMDLPKQIDLRELIKAAVCLAAATDPEVHNLLTFRRMSRQIQPETRTIVPFDEYSSAMASFINKRLTELQERKELPLIDQIRVMTLTCFYWQPAHPSERFEPMRLFGQLVSLVHTHGIHLELLSRTHVHSQLDAGACGSRVFSCLYALDRLLSSCAGRPVMFHNVDLIRIPRPDKHDPPTFRLFMSLILLLDQVIEMYRPSPKISCVDVPVFERLAIEAEAQNEPEGVLASLEVLYHAICVLSVRMSRDRFRTAPDCDAVPGPRYQHLPPNGMNARRSHSADRILDVIRDYKLSPMPFVPYALTLSLSVAYRKWRFSQLPMFRIRGGADFKRVLAVLQDMGQIWSSARVNSRLGKAVMLKLDRNEILGSRRGTDGAGEGSRATSNRRAHPGVLREHGNQRSPLRMGPQDDAQLTRATTPPGAPSSPRTPVEPTDDREYESAVNNTPLVRSPPFQESNPPRTTSSLAERPPTIPLTWTTPWSNGLPPTSDSSNLAWALHHTEPIPGTKSHPPPAEQPFIPPGRDDHGEPGDAIPLPGDARCPLNAMDGTLPVEGLDAFLADDDALFRSWDPRFAQSVDFSFSSILDPGNPFAWPEYCNSGA